MRRDFFSRAIVCLLIFLISFGISFGILCLGGKENGEEASAYETPVPETSEPVTYETPEPDVDTPETESMTAAPETETETAAPQEHSITPPYHDEAAPEGYFDDALFFGNSLIEGLGLYSLLYDDSIAQAKFDTATSMTVFGAGDYINDAATGGYGKIYIGLGLNEIGYDHEAIRRENEKAIDTIREGNPDAIIYLFSLTPISRYKSENDSLYNNTNAAAISQVLREVAEEKDCYFMDMVPVLAGDDGYLPSDVTTDGVHFTKEYYPKWYDYLEHNYVLP